MESTPVVDHTTNGAPTIDAPPPASLRQPTALPAVCDPRKEGDRKGDGQGKPDDGGGPSKSMEKIPVVDHTTNSAPTIDAPPPASLRQPTALPAVCDPRKEGGGPE